MTDIPTEAALLERIKAFLARHDMAPSRFGREATGEPQLISSIEKGRSPSLKVARHLGAYMAEQDRVHGFHAVTDSTGDRNASATKADGIIGDGAASPDLANNRQENICDAGGEGGHRTPFSVTEAATAASSPICSTTIEQPASPGANPASSNTPEVRAA